MPRLTFVQIFKDDNLSHRFVAVNNSKALSHTLIEYIAVDCLGKDELIKAASQILSGNILSRYHRKTYLSKKNIMLSSYLLSSNQNVLFLEESDLVDEKFLEHVYQKRFFMNEENRREFEEGFRYENFRMDFLITWFKKEKTFKEKLALKYKLFARFI